MATTRLRKTFQYPVDNDDDDSLGDLDEEEQEKLIVRFKKEDEDRNELYKRILIILPIIAALSFFPTLTTSGIYSAKLTSVLSITSLMTTAYTLYFVPRTRSAHAPKRDPPSQPSRGPLERYIELTNGVLSALLGFNAALSKSRHGIVGEHWLQNLLPILAFIVVTLARRLMNEVDISELEKLKYGYKGA